MSKAPASLDRGRDIRRPLGPAPEFLTAFAEEAARRQAQLTKPTGSLGRLEEIVIRIAGMTGQGIPSARRKAVIVFAADHGVACQRVSAYPQQVTAQMLANFDTGGAAICALAAAVRANLVVVDCGVINPASSLNRVKRHPIREGTSDFSQGAAMSADELQRAIATGADAVDEESARGLDILALGEMGIGNTTSAAALTAIFCKRDVADVTGPGTGLSQEGVRHKVGVIARALDVNRPNPTDALEVLRTVGGFEIAALAGAMIRATQLRLPVILDGFVTGAAALAADRLAPGARNFFIAGHLSPEPGHKVQLSFLDLQPLLDLRMRLGEGTGAATALAIVEAACQAHASMQTFDAAGVARAH